jgi:hypothetical protein
MISRQDVSCRTTTQRNPAQPSSSSETRVSLQGDQVMAGRRKLHSEELRNLHCSRNIITTIKLRRMTRVGHAASRGETKDVNRISVGKPERKRPSKELVVDVNIILK